MAIVQISQITNRKGLQIDLPQLAGAELGWSIDERRLFIGNGTLEEGAPVIGNTEILTEFSDIFSFQTNYTYKGEAAGYTVQTGPTPSTPITQSLQSWLDQFATVKDFGAVGDGVTDDTDAINRALYQLFCRETNPQIRRSLFFPAGVYRVTESILIPPYATLWGEGADNSIIRLDDSVGDSTLNAYVARTTNSLQQYGTAIPLAGTPPQFITVSNMGFENLDSTTDVFLVEYAANCTFKNVSFVGPFSTSYIKSNTATVTTADTAGVRFISNSTLVCDQIVFDTCNFGGTTYGINTSQQTKSVVVCNSKFDALYQGVALGTGAVVNGGPTGTKIVANVFDNVYAEGIIFATELNASGHNIFYDVANSLDGVTNPSTNCIVISGNNNVSISDMFERSDAFATTWPRILQSSTDIISMVNGRSLSLGQLTSESTQQATLNASQASPVAIFTMPIVVRDLTVRYVIQGGVGGNANRSGTLVVASNSVSGVTFTDDFVQNADTYITLSASESSGIITVSYTSGASSAQMKYSISYINSTTP